MQDIDMCGMDDKELGIYMHKVRYNPSSPRVVNRLVPAGWKKDNRKQLEI